LNNIQNPTTLAAFTGTGELYVAYSSDANSAVFKHLTTGNTISIKRTQPKPSGTSLGVERIEAKLTRYFTVSGVVHSMIATVSTSLPVAVADATERDNFWKMIAFLVRGSEFELSLKQQTIPL